MPSKALTYAEEALGVHTVYQDAIAKRNSLDGILSELAQARDERREVESQLADAEMDVITEQRGKHPDMPVTRWDKHIKEAFQKNNGVRNLRVQLSKVSSDIEGLEFDRSILEVDIKICVSRMNELGGYFYYLAEVKRAALTPTTPAQPTETGETQ